MKEYARKILPVFAVTMFVCAAVVFLFYISDGVRQSAKNVVQTLVAPGQSAVTAAANRITRVFSNMGENEELRQQLEEANKKVSEYEEQLRLYQHYADRNQELSKLLGITEEYRDYDYVHATVTSKNDGIFFYSFTVNKGARDGIKVNDTVINGDGIIGRVSEVFTTSSKVTTLLDEDTRVSSVMTGSRDMVMVYGSYQLKTDGLLMMEYIPSQSNIRIGDMVETSGIGGIYPGGLIIGTVEALTDEKSGIEQFAIVKPVVNFSKIETVMILSTGGQEDTGGETE